MENEFLDLKLKLRGHGLFDIFTEMQDKTTTKPYVFSNAESAGHQSVCDTGYPCKPDLRYYERVLYYYDIIKSLYHMA